MDGELASISINTCERGMWQLKALKYCKGDKAVWYIGQQAYINDKEKYMQR